MARIHSITGALALVAAALTIGTAHAGPNLLANGSFNTPSGTGPTSLMGADNGGLSAASRWLTFNNSDATTTTELLASPVIPGGSMIHVTTSGNYNGLYQTFAASSQKAYACTWVYVVSGAVGVGVGDGINTTPGMIVLNDKSWEVVNVGNGSMPASEAIIYSYGGPAEFYVESASVSTSQAQCLRQ